MKISVQAARELIAAMTESADVAEASGATEFEFIGSLQANAQAALDQLQSDINKAG